VNQEESEQNEVDGMNKDSTGNRSFRYASPPVESSPLNEFINLEPVHCREICIDI